MRDLSIAEPLRAKLADARRPFDDLCGVLFLLTASVARARRNGGPASELDAIDAHAGRAIAIARALGESISAFMSAVESLLAATDGAGPLEIAVVAGSANETVVRVRTSGGKAVEVSFKSAV